jgi:hypothetical protein
MSSLGTQWSAVIGCVTGGIAATVLNGFLTRVLGKSKTLIDPQTGQPVELRSNNSLFFVPMGCWTPIFLLGGIVIGIIGFIGEGHDKAMSAKYPGKTVFEAANNLIDSRTNDISHGNTPDAQAAAAGFSQKLKQTQALFFTGGSKKNFLTGGDFLTYCRKNKDSVIFICHVPSLRSYKDDDTKKSLGELASVCAASAAPIIEGYSASTKVIVALRGITSYGIVSSFIGDEDPQITLSDDTEIFFELFDPKNEGTPGKPQAAKVDATEPTATPPVPSPGAVGIEKSKQ